MAKIDLKEYLERLEEPEDREAVANREYQKELFEEYVSMAGKGDSELRAELLREYRAGAPLTGPKGLRRKLGAVDLEYFGRAYLAHYFVRKSPAFHGELDRIWRDGVMKGKNPTTQAKEISRADGCRRAIEAPRGHAKSTTFTFKDSIHAAAYAYKHYEIILSDSSEQAEGFLGDIKTEFEENAALREDFGELPGRVWKASVILLTNGVKIEAIGSGKKIRGRRHKQWRPDLIVCDDLENDENVNTAEQRKKLRNWFYKAVSKAGDTYTDIVYIGTLLHFDALLANVANNPSYKTVKYRGVISFAENTELWDAWEAIYTDLTNEKRQEEARAFYEAHEAEMLEGTAVLWKEKLSYYDLMVIRISEGEASFNSEIQNEPIDPESCTFQEEWFDFWDDEGKQLPDFSDPRFVFIGANDPSLGKNKKSDTSSIFALAKDTSTGYIYVLIADIAKRKPDQIIEDAIEASRRLKRDYKRPYYQFGVETVQFQYYFAEIMRQKSAAIGEYLPIVEINSVQNKDARIQSLQPFVKNGYVKFSKKHKTLLKQMYEYPMGKNDDGPDGLQMAVKLALEVKVGRKVDYQSVQARAMKFRRGAY
jgi:predicted phage terminase large subunit-like protein|nr:MAG TPA: Large Terminase [Caudoviricetes sp.]